MRMAEAQLADTAAASEAAGTASDAQPAVPPELLAEGRNYFHRLSEEDPTVGIHTTLVASGEAVRLPSLEIAPGTITVPPNGGTPRRLGKVAVELTAVIPTPQAEVPASQQVLNIHTLRYDIEKQGAAVQLEPIFVADGAFHPLSTLLGLERNPLIAGRLATEDGTADSKPLAYTQAIGFIRNELLPRSVVLGNRSCFIDPKENNPASPDKPVASTALSPTALSLVVPQAGPDGKSQSVITGLVETHGAIAAIPLEPAVLRHIAYQDPETRLVGWLEVDSDGGVTVYGQDSLQGLAADAPKLPCLRIQSAVALEQPGTADPQAVSAVVHGIHAAAGWEVDDEDLSPESSFTSAATLASSQGTPNSLILKARESESLGMPHLAQSGAQPRRSSRWRI